MDADVDGMALLGGDLAERVHRVSEGDGTEREPQSQLQQTKLYCKANCQRNKNANEDVPSAHELPLKGEWTGCASSEASDPKGNENASNTAIEHADGLCEQSRLADIDEVELEGCKGGTSEGVSVDEADGEAGRGIEPADIPNKPKMLITMLIELESPNSGEIPRVRLGSTSVHARDANGPGNQADESSGRANVLKGLPDGMGAQTDTSNALNVTETEIIDHGEGAGTYLCAGDAKRIVDVTDGIGSQTDMSSGYVDVLSIETYALIPTTTPGIVRTTRKKAKPPDLPVEATRGHPDRSNGLRHHTDTPSVWMDAYSVETDTETAEYEVAIVRTCQNGSRTRNSLYTRETATPKGPKRWRKVSIDNVDVYVLWNAPIEALGTANRTFEFGEVESGRIEAIAPNVEGERAGDGDGN
ncbi:hypothetical protein SCLCIDRAFT_30456 [Scleroderma citrinum Foug A]|uniref:Uncharacterized protein n=1 Tax=Scleroderma citrinum Foug A TaxID=1036808 RepID=A0A0C3D3C8_9AGAM|nr:hypothetical protein SCLCIDRAFT_30456 [Scleroderma citrinum Foug A]